MFFVQGGWGKRFAPDDEYAIQQLASLLEDQQQIEPQYSSEFDSEPEPNDDEKRAWKQFNNGWGKRAESWKNFRGMVYLGIRKRPIIKVSTYLLY